jgi:hypothetical protein
MKQKGEFQKKKEFYKQRQILLDKIKLVKQGIDCVVTYDNNRWLLSNKPFNEDYRDYYVNYSDRCHRPVIVYDMSNKDTRNEPYFTQVDGRNTYSSNKNVMCYAKIINDKTAKFG